MTSETPLEHVAYHEAGHAVAAFKLRDGMVRLSIVPGDDALGSLLTTSWGRSSPEWESSTRMEKRVEARIVGLLAGAEAEMQVSGRRNEAGAAHDDHLATDMACCLSGTAEAAQARLALHAIQARQLVGDPLNWMLIQHLAGVLLEQQQLSGRRVRDLLKVRMQEIATMPALRTQLDAARRERMRQWEGQRLSALSE